MATASTCRGGVALINLDASTCTLTVQRIFAAR